VTLPEPYYERDGITIYCADCRDVLPHLPPVDLVLTDPPYPDYHIELYKQTPIDFLADLNCRQLVFWSARCAFPLDYSGAHVWDKMVGIGCQYEFIYERNGSTAYKVFRKMHVISDVTANFTGDTWSGHPSQKPIQLMRMLAEQYSDADAIVLDPFMGSGSTLRGALDTGRRAIGIEIEERYCEIAVKRLQQSVMRLETA